MRQTRAASAPEQGATKKETVITSMSVDSLLACEKEAEKSGRQRYLRGMRVITPTGVQKEQIGPNSSHQLMVHTLQKTTYVPAHKHPDKWEYFSMEEFGKGKLKVICFDDAGKVSKVQYLCPGKDSAITISVGVYHSVVAMEDATQVEEIKPGEFKAETDKVLADWAPAEDSPERFEFRRWLELCKVGDEARHYKAILATYDSQRLSEIAAHQEILSKMGEVIREQNEAIKQNQAMLLRLEAQRALKEVDTQKIASQIARPRAPSPEPTCGIGYWPFWSAPAESSSGVKESSIPNVNIVNAGGTINFNFFSMCPQRSEAPERSAMQDHGQTQIISRDASDSQTARCSLLGF